MNHAAHSFSVALQQEIKPVPDPNKMDPRYGVEGKQWKDVGGRKTIVNKKGEILQWDSKKGEVEVYKSKKHQGGYDPYNKDKQISKPQKGRVPNGGWQQKNHKFFNLMSRVLGRGFIPIFMPIFIESDPRYGGGMEYMEI